MRTFTCSLRKVALGLLNFVLLLATAYGGIRAPGKYNGVVIFDRWGACYLYSGVYLMAISEKVKESLRVFQGKPVLVDAQKVRQPRNPGDGLITKLSVLGPAEEPISGHFDTGPVSDGLSLNVATDFRADGPDELIIQLRNNGSRRLEIDTDDLAPTILASKQGAQCFLEPTDGPSYAAVTRANITSLRSGSERWSSCMVTGNQMIARLSLAPGTAISQRFGLEPGLSIEVPILFQLSPGEYEFLAGYGGGVHAARSLASNQIAFDVDESGKAHIPGVASPVQALIPPLSNVLR